MRLGGTPVTDRPSQAEPRSRRAGNADIPRAGAHTRGWARGWGGQADWIQFPSGRWKVLALGRRRGPHCPAPPATELHALRGTPCHGTGSPAGGAP